MTETETSKEHYLKTELYELVQTDRSIFDFLQAGSLDGMWYWDLENPENEWMSPKLWTELGYDPNEMPHKVEAWQEIIFQEDLAVAISNFEKHLADPNHPYDQIVRYRHKNGSTVWIRCRGIIIRNEKGEGVRMLGAHNNVTEIKEAEQKLAGEYGKVKVLNSELAIKNQDLEYFTNVASHDLKEPIRVINGYIEMIKEELDDLLTEETKQYMVRVMESAQRMNVLLDDLLDLARLGKTQVKLESCELSEVMKNVLFDLQDVITDSDASIKHNFNGKKINADPSLMYILFGNLIGNAIKYAKKDEKALVTLELTEDDDYWQISISDNGIGIEEQHFERIFVIFQRLHTRSEYPGTGVGLSICKKVVELHSGKITCESELGIGSTFNVFIPKKT